VTLLALAILAVLGLLVTPGPTRAGWYCVHCGAAGALLTACSVCGTVAKASTPPPPEPEPEPAPEPIPPRHPVDPRRPRVVRRLLAALSSRGEL